MTSPPERCRRTITDSCTHQPTPSTVAPHEEAGWEQHRLVVLDWLKNYVSVPHPQLGRTGSVCPFVPPALRDGKMEMVFHPEVDGNDPESLRRIVSQEMDHFAKHTPRPSGLKASLASRLVVLPRIEDGQLHTVDDVYPRLKDEAVGRDLMIGQFHPQCDEPAIRNPLFPVSRSPIPLYAVRHMAPHDVLFLHSKSAWFEKYRAIFGGAYERGQVRDSVMRKLYSDAQRLFGEESAQ